MFLTLTLTLSYHAVKMSLWTCWLFWLCFVIIVFKIFSLISIHHLLIMLWCCSIHLIKSVPIVDCYQKIRQQVKCYLQMAGVMGKNELQEVSCNFLTFCCLLNFCGLLSLLNVTLKGAFLSLSNYNFLVASASSVSNINWLIKWLIIIKPRIAWWL